jgi:hypothetical protein
MMGLEFLPQSVAAYSIHSAAPKPAARDWDWQSVVQLLNGTTGR